MCQVVVILGSANDSIEQLAKQRKVQCPSCLEIFNKNTYKKHVANNCESIQKLIKNGEQCCVCDKIFSTKHAVKQHVSQTHKEEVQNQK